MKEDTRQRLASVSVATISTALLKHGYRNTVLHRVKPLKPYPGKMVGPAYTLRYIPAREDIDIVEIFEDPDHPQRKAVETIPPGAVLVIDARQDDRAATAGSILLKRLEVRGAAGIVTDGGLRDTPVITQTAFPAYCASASAPTNLIHHHAVDIDVPIGCGGVAVYPGDIIVGDGEAVVAIPRDRVAEVAEEAEAMTRFEDWAEARVGQGQSIIGLYPPSTENRRLFELDQQST